MIKLKDLLERMGVGDEYVGTARLKDGRQVQLLRSNEADKHSIGKKYGIKKTKHVRYFSEIRKRKCFSRPLAEMAARSARILRKLREKMPTMLVSNGCPNHYKTTYMQFRAQLWYLEHDATQLFRMVEIMTGLEDNGGHTRSLIAFLTRRLLGTLLDLFVELGTPQQVHHHFCSEI